MEPPELFRLSHAPTYPVEVPGGETWLPLACNQIPVSPRWLTEPGSSKPAERVPSGNTATASYASGSYQVTSDCTGAGLVNSDGDAAATPSPFSSASAGASVLLAAGIVRNTPSPSTGGGLVPAVVYLQGADDIASTVSLTSLLGDMPGYALAARESLGMLGAEVLGQSRFAGVPQE